MNLLPKAILLTIILLTISCKCKKIAEKETDNQQKEMMEAGFKKAVILHSEKEGDCPYTLAIDNEELFF